MVRLFLLVFLLVFLLLLLFTVLRSLMKGLLGQRNKQNTGLEAEELVQDPCCQTYIPKRTALRKKVGGREYYFCNKECVTKFLDKKNPRKSEESNTEA